MTELLNNMFHNWTNDSLSERNSFISAHKWRAHAKQNAICSHESAFK